MAKKPVPPAENPIEFTIDDVAVDLQAIRVALEKIEGHMAVQAELAKLQIAVMPRPMTGQPPSRQPLVAGQQYPRSGDTYGPKK
jgi:hypothetical protein